jgi:2-polyprenyl-6-methoxyphenol hydroxylase-like FAD-dependent oxidoreductase
VVDKGRCYVLLIGAAGDHAPSDDEGFAAFAGSLRNPDIAECVAKATPLSRAYRFTNTRNRWTNFHTMSQWPERLVAIGDSVCTFNPVYGQGLTVAALEAVELGRLLDGHRGAPEPTGIGRTFQRRVARLLRNPWNMTTSTDLGWHEGKAPLGARIAKWFMTAIFESLPTNPDLYRRLVRVTHMVDPPSVMMRPGVVLGVIAHALRRRFGSRPSGLDAQPTLPGRVDEPFRAA